MNKKIILFVISLCCPILVEAETLVVTADNSQLASLSKSDVRQLYMGNTKTAEGHKVMLLDMPEGSAERQSFYHRVAGKNESQLKSYWARMIFTGKGTPPMQVRDSGEMVRKLKGNPQALGYMQASELKPGLKVLLRLP